MDYILKNWSELNLIDRAWFLGGAWLAILLISVLLGNMIKKIKKK